MKDALVIVQPLQAEELPSPEDVTEPRVGRWYWRNTVSYEYDDNDNRVESVVPEFCCVIYLGSNYALVENIEGGKERVAFEEWDTTCRFESNPDRVIDEALSQRKESVHALMARIREVTARLALASSRELNGKPEVQTLALRTEQPMDEYKAALIKAQQETLPDLFNEVKAQQRELATWMSAKLIPLKAQAESLQDIMHEIKQRIFNVELYAGIVEEIVQVKDGAPAEMTEKIYLMQRRLYMDEECLARYEVGGMEFRDIAEFDKWLCRKDIFNRIFPFRRGIVAFRVRRWVKDRPVTDIASFVRFQIGSRTDMYTYLYMRNGDQLFRLTTGIEFDEKLFPDMSQDKLGRKLWAKMFCDRIDELITDDEYQEIRKRGDTFYTYEPFEPGNVYYDDISEKIQEEMAKHNRLVLVLQGLLDRSPVFHPHPPWSLWHPESFQQALSLIYDDSRALSGGDKPDFLAYEERLRSEIREGSITIGQHRYWLEDEADKGRDKSYRHHRDPGPGYLAEVVEFKSRSKKCLFAWERKRVAGRDLSDPEKKDTIRRTLSVPTEALFNVSAYKPGDFRLFYDDPRTRAEYLEWAPFLLTAEEYHAGNREVVSPPKEKQPKREASRAAKLNYRKVKAAKYFHRKAVRLLTDIETRGGHKYKEGTIWRAYRYGTTLTITGVLPDGSYDPVRRSISKIDPIDLILAPEIPDPPKPAEDEEEDP